MTMTAETKGKPSEFDATNLLLPVIPITTSTGFAICLSFSINTPANLASSCLVMTGRASIERIAPESG